MAERPKIKAHVEVMKNNISKTLKIDNGLIELRRPQMKN